MDTQASPVTPQPTVAALFLPGWIEKDSAVSILINDCIFDPPLSRDRAERIWQEYNQRVNAINMRIGGAPQRLPLDRHEQNAADTFIRFHRQRGHLGSIREVIKIDPMGLIAHQPIVVIDQAAKYTADATSAASYARHSLGTAAGAHNLQLQGGLNAVDVALPHGEFAFFFNQQMGRFEVTELARHISVTEFQNRMLLFAGYHRSYARIERANIEGMDRSLLVALTTDGDFLLSTASPNQGLRATLCGFRPPLLRDFFDPDFVMRVHLKRKRFVLQVRAQIVPIDAV
jgi:hypothetical protein